MYLFTTVEVCDFLRVSRRTLLRLRAEGRAPRALVIGGRLRWPDEDLNAFLTEKYQDDEQRQAAARKVSV